MTTRKKLVNQRTGMLALADGLKGMDRQVLQRRGDQLGLFNETKEPPRSKDRSGWCPRHRGHSRRRSRRRCGWRAGCWA